MPFLYLHYPNWLHPEIIPGLPIRWYGLMYLVGFYITYLLVLRQIREDKLDISKDDVGSYALWAILGLLIGGRVFSSLIYDISGVYRSQPWLIFWPFDSGGRFVGFQGMSYHGAAIGIAIATALFAKIKKVNFLEWGDLLLTALPLGYTFGRLGNFINGELFGRVTTLPWGMIFPQAPSFPTSESWVKEIASKIHMNLEGLLMVNLPRHPSQLYEAFFEGIGLWLFMWFVVRPRRPFAGFAFGMYLVGYGFVRFLIEYVREPDAGIGFPIMLDPAHASPYLFQSPWNFTLGQILNVLMVVCGLGVIWLSWGIHRKKTCKAEDSVQRNTKK